MRTAFGMVLGLAVAALVGCAPDDSAGSLRGGGPGGPNNPNPNDPSQPTNPADTTPQPTPAEVACATAPTVATLSDVKDAHDVTVVGQAVFFQSGPTIKRVAKDGIAKADVYTNPNAVRSFVDRNSLIVIESAVDNPNATLRVIKATLPEAGEEGAPPPAEPAFPSFPVGKEGEQVGTATATNFNAAGTYVFGSDDTSFYLLADTANGDQTLLKINKDNPGQQTALATVKGVITYPQVASSAVWYVRDGQRIYKVALQTEDQPQGEPTEMFGIGYASCNLAVSETAVFCTTNSTIERRDMTGGSPNTIFTAQSSKTQAPFGRAQISTNNLFVRSEAPDVKVKHVIRSIDATSAAESLVACGRNLVTGVSVDKTHVAWSEADTGVFIAVR